MVGDVPVTGRRDEVQKRVNTCVLESRLALDPTVNSEDLIVLPLNVADDVSEAVHALVKVYLSVGEVLTLPHCRSDLQNQGC